MTDRVAVVGIMDRVAVVGRTDRVAVVGIMDRVAVVGKVVVNRMRVDRWMAKTR